jgi:hypothetical protein
MTQEEIEALMSGNIGGAEDETTDSGQEDSTDIDSLLSEIETSESTEGNSEVSNEESESIDDILAGIDGVVDDSDSSDESFESQNIDDILAGIDGIVDDGSSTEETPTHEVESIPSEPAPEAKEDLDNKIEQGIYPMPVENEHKVVSQLSQVAEDSEAKASQIFDVLSFILDENDGINKNLAASTEFIDNQIVLLERLAQKFPGVEVFSESLLKAQEAKTNITAIENTLNDENGKLFEAMELMQFHDINRQKIERVMAVIRKLANYLNGLFEDDSNKPEVQIAKHIDGDSSESVSADDLDALINQYSQEG